MTERLYQRNDVAVPPIIILWETSRDLTEEEFDQIISDGEEVLALSDDAYNAVGAHCLDFPTREELQDQVDDAKDRLDYFSYEKRDHVLVVADGGWFTPIAVESVCGEEAGHEAILSIDGQNNTYWEHTADEAHDIIWQLRDYTKTIDKLEVRIGSSSRNLLTGIDIYIANLVDGLDSPNNLVASGVDLVSPNSWEEIDFVGRKTGQYIRFTGFGSQHASNEVRIQEIRAWVGTTPLNS